MQKPYNLDLSHKKTKAKLQAGCQQNKWEKNVDILVNNIQPQVNLQAFQVFIKEETDILSPSIKYFPSL